MSAVIANWIVSPIIERRTGVRILMENFFVNVIFKNFMLFLLSRQVNRNPMLAVVIFQV